jgi:hypothetical protein
VTFVAPPRLAVLQPGVQVVEDAEDEVFFVDNGYWTRHGNHWYRSPDHRGHWVLADRRVPPSIARYQPGQYRHWKQGGGPRVDRKEQRKGKPEQGRDDRANDGRDEHERGQR